MWLAVLGFALGMVTVIGKVFTWIGAVLAGIGELFGGILAGIFGSAVMFMLSGGLVILVGFVFWEYNPNLRRQVKSIEQHVDRVLQSTIGISLPKIPGIDDAIEILSETKNNALAMHTLATVNIDTRVSLANMGIDLSLVSESLIPMLDTAQDYKTFSQMAELLKSGKLEGNPDAAIPLLSSALKSQDDRLRAAAYHSLQKMNTPAAKQTISNYMRMVNAAGNRTADDVERKIGQEVKRGTPDELRKKGGWILREDDAPEAGKKIGQGIHEALSQ